MSEHDPLRIGIVSISDRASSGVYVDKGLPALKAWLGKALRLNEQGQVVLPHAVQQKPGWQIFGKRF